MFKIIAFDLDGTIADTIPMCIWSKPGSGDWGF